MNEQIVSQEAAESVLIELAQVLEDMADEVENADPRYFTRYSLTAIKKTDQRYQVSSWIKVYQTAL